MKVLISGAHGLVGSALRGFFQSRGDHVMRLVRSRAAAGEGDIYWDPSEERAQRERMEGADAVIHLAGENLASGRWTAAKKRRIWDSRVQGTQFLCRTLLELKSPPRVFLCASAVGLYGDRGDELLSEGSSAGKGFLAELCQAWEAACALAVNAGIRVVHLRFGMILSAGGGALPQMLTPFRLGLGGRIGSGNQYLSWIAIGDVARAVDFLLNADIARGTFNIVSPHPVTNREFTATLAKVLKRPAFFTMPEFAARLAFGEMADEALLSSARVVPSRLIEFGFDFQFPELKDALRRILSPPVSD